MTLDERKKSILASIIKDYVETAEPVGSRAVVKKHALNVSAATVRNEMADLEEMGYLEQPHTSAGRIPSQLGYRYYVDCMMEMETLTDEEIEALYNMVAENINDWNEVIEKVGQFLSQVTNYASFVIVPSIKFSEFKYLQIVPIEQSKALVLIVTDMGLVMHRKIDIPESMKDMDLKMIGKAFNKAFSGRKLTEMSRTDLQFIRDDLTERRTVIDRALEAVDNLLESTNEDRAIISGALNIINEPEFKDLEKLRSILAILEEGGLLRKIIPETTGDQVDIIIGSENQFDAVKELSLVLAGYSTFGEKGKIGLVGPVRMEYWKAAGTVETVSKIIEEIIKGNF